LSISSAGRVLMASIFPGHAEVIRRATAGPGPEEKRTLIVLLKRLGLGAANELEPETTTRRGASRDRTAAGDRDGN